MNIALINLPLSSNYGANLQRFALYRTLTKLGNKVTYIPLSCRDNIYPKGLKGFFVYSKRLIKKYIFGHKTVDVLSERKKAKDNAIQMPQIIRFNEEYLNIWDKVYNNFTGMEELNSKGFDAFVVGSDQIWRFGSDIEHYFLDFVDDNKIKIAYAASFGNAGEDYSDYAIKRCSKLLNSFQAVSFREYVGFDIFYRFNWKCQSDPKWVLDPTLLLEADDYRGVYSKYSNSEKKGIFYYILDINNEKLELLQQVSTAIHLKKYGITTLFPNIGKGTKITIPSIEQWLRYIDESKFVVTDSFHGTMFSIIFNKPFLSIINNERGNQRYYPLMEKLGLGDRLISEDNLKSFSFNHLHKIDWELVNKKLQSLRADSINFLKSSLIR